MTISEENLDGGVTKLTLDGRLDIEGAKAVDQKMNAIAGSRNAVLVDLQRVSFLASMGIRSLVIAAKAIKERGGQIVILGPNAFVEKVLKISGIDSVIPIHKSLDSALAALR